MRILATHSLAESVTAQELDGVTFHREQINACKHLNGGAKFNLERTYKLRKIAFW